MNTLFQRISQIAMQLEGEGKKPSLALVRARLGGGIDPATLFSAYQQWRNSPKLDASSLQSAPTPELLPVADESPITRADLARLEQKLDQLLALLQAGNGHVVR